LKLPRGFFKGCDACCVIGGDGTLLGAAGGAARENIPIIGVNQGSLGFLTTFSADEARTQFASMLRGGCGIAHRTLLECKTGPGERDVALNDVLVKNETNSRLVRLEVLADGMLVTEYYCDGIIFSTPTGSTAYNLAAGGPIIHPAAGVIAMTPICPHTLSNRTIIFRDNVKLTVINRSTDSRLLVAMDGQRNTAVTEDVPIEISISPEPWRWRSEWITHLSRSCAPSSSGAAVSWKKNRPRKIRGLKRSVARNPVTFFRMRLLP